MPFVPVTTEQTQEDDRHNSWVDDIADSTEVKSSRLDEMGTRSPRNRQKVIPGLEKARVIMKMMAMIQDLGSLLITRK